MVINTPTGSGARSDGYEIRSAATRRGIPCITTMTGASAAARAIGAQRSGGARACAACRSCTRSATVAAGGRGAVARARAAVLAPFGRRRSRGRRQRGHRRLPADHVGRPGRAGCRAAGQFYMLTCERGWGGGGERPYLPRAFSVADAEPTGDGRPPLVPARGRRPGHPRARRARAGRRPAADRSARATRSRRRRAQPRRRGGDPGRRRDRPRSARALARASSPQPACRERSLLGFRDRAHSGGLELFRCSEVRLASEDGHAGHRGYVTDLLAVMLEGDAAATPAVYACGPPGMLEAVRALCAERGVEAELAMESPMACGYGACFGCAVPLRDGRLHAALRRRPRGPRRRRSRRRWSRERAPMSAVDLCGIAPRAPDHQRLGDVRRDRRAPGVRRRGARALPVQRLRLEDDHPRAARRQRPAAALGGARRDGQLDRPAEQGPRGLPR